MEKTNGRLGTVFKNFVFSYKNTDSRLATVCLFCIPLKRTNGRLGTRILMNRFVQ